MIGEIILDYVNLEKNINDTNSQPILKKEYEKNIKIDIIKNELNSKKIIFDKKSR